MEFGILFSTWLTHDREYCSVNTPPKCFLSIRTLFSGMQTIIICPRRTPPPRLPALLPLIITIVTTHSLPHRHPNTTTTTTLPPLLRPLTLEPDIPQAGSTTLPPRPIPRAVDVQARRGLVVARCTPARHSAQAAAREPGQKSPDLVLDKDALRHRKDEVQVFEGAALRLLDQEEHEDQGKKVQA